MHKRSMTNSQQETTKKKQKQKWANNGDNITKPFYISR